MTVTVQFFARARELAGRAGTSMTLPAGATVPAVLDALVRQYPALAPLAPYLRVAVNQQLVDGERIVREGDDLAIFPPMSGG